MSFSLSMVRLSCLISVLRLLGSGRAFTSVPREKVSVFFFYTGKMILAGNKNSISQFFDFFDEIFLGSGCLPDHAKVNGPDCLFFSLQYQMKLLVTGQFFLKQRLDTFGRFFHIPFSCLINNNYLRT